MNRSERRNLEKKLGVIKHLKTLSREEKFERMRNNQESGKKTHQEFVERSALSEMAQIEQKESDRIASEANNIAKTTGIPFIDALAQAQDESKKSK